MAALRSDILTGGDTTTTQRLEDCANGRPNEAISHLTINERGDHVRRVQQALINAMAADPALQAAMAKDKVPSVVANGVYDGTFAAAVQAYKRHRNIRNYRNEIDSIVGVKTIRTLDAENQRQSPVPTPPDIPKPIPNIPDTPPIEPPTGFRRSGWEITGIAGALGTIPTPIPNLSAGGGVLTLTLENKFRKLTATYALDGVAASFGKDLGKMIPSIKPLLDRLKGRGGSVGPSFFPTVGSEIFVTPWVSEPVEASEFACFAAITSGNAAFGVGGGLNVIAFSIVPFIPLAIVGTATIKGVGVFFGSGLSTPTLSADAFHSKSFLKSVTPTS